MSKELYNLKNNNYYNQVRFDAVEVINKFIDSKQGLKILDIGCGTCETIIYLKEKNIASHVTGIELMKISNSNQENKLIDKLYIGEVESELNNIEAQTMDIVLCLDVLEHLVDPWKIVNIIESKLKTGGHLIISCPNIREVKTIFNIFFKGSFRYEDAGIMDKTHLRFFTATDLKRLGTTNLLQPIDVVANYKMAPNRGKLKFLHFGLLDPIFAPQYFVISKKQ